jgi:MYXO-CTERM domain-containing protein
MGSGGTTSAGAGGSVPMGTGGSSGSAQAGTGGAGEEPGGCGCRVVGQPQGSKSLAALALLGLGVSVIRRRHSRRRAS